MYKEIKETKDWLKGIGVKLKDEAKYDIAYMVIDGIKIRGPLLFVLLIKPICPHFCVIDCAFNYLFYLI
jgi:hypothetical protein